MANFSRLKIFALILVLTSSWSPYLSAAPFKAHKIAISCANRHAVDAATEIALAGGNAVDMAITAALVMSVTNPYFAALGGGGFALIKMKPKGKAPAKVEVLDFREQAPAATHAQYFKDKEKDSSITGGAAVAVPGIPAGLYELHKKHGKLHWSRLFQQPIHLATKGFRISGELADRIRSEQQRMNPAAKKRFLKIDGTNFKAGELLRQPQLGAALSEMRNRNIVSFYRGQVASDIVASVRAAGGDLSLNDMKKYQVVWREPLKTSYADHDIYLMPPPSSGGIIIQTALALTERLNLKKYPIYSTDEYHLLGEILSRSFRGRSLINDPDHHPVPMTQLLSDSTLKELEDSIDLKKATSVSALAEPTTESNETTHLSILDMDGNAVSMTLTLNGNFGSGVLTSKYGIMLNNEMDDFTTRPGEPNLFGLVQGAGNSVQPGKRPLSSMSPTLVLKDNKVVMAVGAPGGPRIISSVFQTLYRTYGRGQNLERAIESPRIHHQLLPNILYVDKHRFTPETLENLRSRKHVIEESWLGRVYAVQNVGDHLEAVADTRIEGFSGGF